MNEQAINDAYKLFSNAGWSGDVNQFLSLINSNSNALSDAYQLFTKQGYNKDENEFSKLMGLEKTEGAKDVDAPIVPKVNIEDTELASELSSLGLSDEEFNSYQTGVNNALAETEAEMNNVLKLAEQPPTSKFLATKGFLGQFKKKNVYVFDEFLNEDQSNIEEAKEKWIQQQRERIQSAKLEEVFEDLKSDVLPWWTGPVGIVGKIGDLAAGSDKTLKMVKNLISAKGENIDEKIADAWGLEKQELKYEKVRNILYNEYTEKLDSLDKEGSKIVDNIKISHSQFDILDSEISILDAYYKDNPPTTQAQVDYFNGLIQNRQALYAVYKKNKDRLGEISINLKSIENIADLVKRTYSNVDVVSNRVESTVLKLKSGLTKTVKELTVGLEEKIFDVDLNSEENLKILPEYIRPFTKGMGNLGDYLNKTSLELYNEAEKINKFTEKRQSLEDVDWNIENFGEFMLDLFSEQGVNTAITASTGGLGLFVIAAGATGNKFTAMDLELENGRYNSKTNEFDKIKISPMQYYGAGIGYGFAEFITEKVALDNYKLGVKGFRKALDIAGGKYSLKAMSFKGALKTYGVSVGREGTSEWVANLMQNSLDRYVLENKEVGVWDGASEAFGQEHLCLD